MRQRQAACIVYGKHRSNVTTMPRHYATFSAAGDYVQASAQQLRRRCSLQQKRRRSQTRPQWRQSSQIPTDPGARSRNPSVHMAGNRRETFRVCRPFHSMTQPDVCLAAHSCVVHVLLLLQAGIAGRICGAVPRALRLWAHNAADHHIWRGTANERHLLDRQLAACVAAHRVASAVQPSVCWLFSASMPN